MSTRHTTQPSSTFLAPSMPLEDAPRPTPAPRGARAALGLGRSPRPLPARPEPSTSTHEAGRVLLRFPRKPSRQGGAREELRIALRFYEGRSYIDARIWFEAQPDWKPTPRGITVRSAEIGQLVAALSGLSDQLGANDAGGGR